MKKYRIGLIAAGILAAGSARTEVVITSPTGLPDESDVVLERSVDAVRSLPKETVEAVRDTAGYVADEVRNTGHGIVSAFQPPAARTVRREAMLDAVGPEWDPQTLIEMRTYVINEKTGKEMMLEADPGGAVLDVSSFFMGIRFPEGTSAFYRPKFGRLIVQQTPANLRAIEEMLGLLGGQPDYRQIEIETRFVEVEQRTLNELGFDWTFNSDWIMQEDWAADLTAQTLDSTLRSAASAFNAGAAGTMALTKDGWLPLDLAIRALEQSGGADLLSAPRITTRDGKKAEIWVGDREVMPTSFEASSENTSVFVEYEDWEKINVGVHLEVTPERTKEGRIHLELKPEVIDLVGYDDYEVTPDNANMLIWGGRDSSQMTVRGRYPIPNIPGAVNDAWNKFSATLGGEDPNTYIPPYIDLEADDTRLNNTTPAYYQQDRRLTHEEAGLPVPQLKGSLPILRVRKIDTSMTVADGSTVGLGGLIYDKLETYKDKVPVLGSIPLLGRLFRSEGERSIKRNLMIFVSATQVDVTGRRAADLAVNP